VVRGVSVGGGGSWGVRHEGDEGKQNRFKAYRRAQRGRKNLSVWRYGNFRSRDIRGEKRKKETACFLKDCSRRNYFLDGGSSIQGEKYSHKKPQREKKLISIFLRMGLNWPEGKKLRLVTGIPRRRKGYSEGQEGVSGRISLKNVGWELPPLCRTLEKGKRSAIRERGGLLRTKHPGRYRSAQPQYRSGKKTKKGKKGE